MSFCPPGGGELNNNDHVAFVTSGDAAGGRASALNGVLTERQAARKPGSIRA